MRWLVFSRRGSVAHCVQEEWTGWSRTEKSGVLVSYCGRDSNYVVAVEPPEGTRRCRRCERAVTA